MVRVLAYCSNVGSLCDAPELIPRWVEETRALVQPLGHSVVALHLQELGGQTKSLHGIRQLEEALHTLLGDAYWSTGLLYDGDLERGEPPPFFYPCRKN